MDTRRRQPDQVRAGGGPRPAAPAESLQIAGLVPLSTTDWPDRLTATVYLQGCPWRCTYCHNCDLIDPRTPGRVPWAAVEALLERRAGLLDGVVFSGGEATRQAGLADALARVRRAGFATGLHTAGAYPRRLAALLPLLDWVGLDLKALPAHYPAVAGPGARGQDAWDCLDLLVAAGIAHEVRTTVHPGSVAATDALAVAHAAAARGARCFALQEARTRGTTPAFALSAKEWDETRWRREWRALVAAVQDLAPLQVTVRPA
ncbi:anaerobic ribonucleoside-triphosphate reductase activating protein [Buchananella hordeovulneris]|uniref:anaerobic ribonucleoside-triphosphate reductase activating protein n=1 Tax=Buchananella hordeovulneris TaxID=52770 RepID=UPI000F602E5C|nr:anaerobic ribonucleoside-triphosphate reductase activating protein [Buchananella hordeovulneris]RRD51299.1 anaerobic ribonucleoside-triphosphate reductase activating protein [Buchananella hordeovulneris]